MKTLLFVPGSLRAASSSRATVRALVARVGADVTCVVADPGVLPLYNADLVDNAAVTAWIEAVRTADGIVFVTPEYNFSIPGVLKNAIDWASRPGYNSVFKDKRCFMMSVSGGALGGVRAQAHLKYILDAMLARFHVCKEIVVPHANTKVTDGVLTDAVVLDFAEEALRDFIASL